MTVKQLYNAARSLMVVLATGACTLSVTAYPPPVKTIWLDQGWTAEQRAEYYHKDQGTVTFGIPYEWLVALEQPKLTTEEQPLFVEKGFMDRFGFIPGANILPVGFARSADYTDAGMKPLLNPATGQKLTGVGMTCAACHTGRLTYQGTEILIDGGSALTNSILLNKAMDGALRETKYIPPRFDRFARRVLGDGASDAAREQLRDQMFHMLLRRDKVALLEISTSGSSPEEGFGRLDALNRIGNQVFSLGMNIDSNYAPRTAPVHFPHIWSSPWYSWVQYNGSIMQPMVRNAGEALGVSARVNLTTPGPTLYQSSIPIGHLHWIEDTLAGRPPFPAKAFSGLRSPKWPSLFPAIDQGRVRRGKVLYEELCQGCHLPAPNTAAFWSTNHWKQIGGKGDRYLDVKQIPVERIGTDPEQAAGMARRTVTTSDAVKLKSSSFGLALGEVVENVTNKWYDTRTPPVSQADRDRMNGNRPNWLRTDVAYKARPLNGIWAVPPYLHNGSAPSLYNLLSPMGERPSTVWLGNREYDPHHVGYVNTKIDGGSEFKTDKPGNLNTGHVFTDETVEKGRIGRGLTPEERHSIIEYLKTL